MMFQGYFTQQDEILENKLGITNPAELKQVESTIVALRISEVLQRPPKGKMDYAYLQKLHNKLFSDIYAFAGQTRTVDIAKGGSAFCYVRFIETVQKQIFERVAKEFIPRMKRDSFVEKIARLASDLNALHPFREGNGRTTRLFLLLLARRCHFDLAYDAVEPEQLMQADILAFQGELEPLTELYRKIVTEQ